MYLDKYRLEPVSHEIKDDADVVIDYEIVDVVVKTGDSEEEFYTTKKYKQVGKHSRSKELNKYANDVGCYNIIKKYAKQGIDAGDGRFMAKGPAFTDATKLPRDLEGTLDLAKNLDPKTSEIWKALPKELKGNMTLEEFSTKFDAKMFGDYIKNITHPKVKPEVKPEVNEVKKEGNE